MEFSSDKNILQIFVFGETGAGKSNLSNTILERYAT
jgi:predicted GTPase